MFYFWVFPRERGIKGVRATFLLSLFIAVTSLLTAPIPSSAVSQDHFIYIDAQKAERKLIEPSEQQLYADFYLRQHFLPWIEKGPLYERKKVEEFFSVYLGKLAQGDGKTGKGARITRNARLSDYPDLNLAAVTIDRIDVLGLPYRDRRKREVNLALQASSISRGTPIMISHWSRDRKWYYVETAYVCGWTTPKHLALVSDDFIEKWQRREFVTVVRDGGGTRSVNFIRWSGKGRRDGISSFLREGVTRGDGQGRLSSPVSKRPAFLCPLLM